MTLATGLLALIAIAIICGRTTAMIAAVLGALGGSALLVLDYLNGPF